MAVTVTAKRYAGIVRMRQLLNAHVSGMALHGNALDAGHCDQAHFMKQFRRSTVKLRNASSDLRGLGQHVHLGEWLLDDRLGPQTVPACLLDLR